MTTTRQHGLGRLVNAGLLAAAALLLVATPASAQQRGTKLATLTGACTKFVVSGQDYDCKSVLYMGLPNGRVTFTVAMPNGALTLSGGKDSQLDPTRYVLEIDTIRAGRSTGRSHGYKAKGRCTMYMEADVSRVHGLSCSASNGLEDVTLEFKGDGSKLEVDTH